MEYYSAITRKEMPFAAIWMELEIIILREVKSEEDKYMISLTQLSLVQSLSRVRLFATPWIAAHQASLSITNSRSSPKHPAISSSVVPFSSSPQSLPASESFPMSQLFAWGGQSIGVSALASVLPKNTQDWSPSEWTGWISCSPRDSQESSPTPQFKS